MKKIYQIIVLCTMTVALASCGGGGSGKADYKSAIGINDYEAAHKIIKQLGMDFEEKELNNWQRVETLGQMSVCPLNPKRKPILRQ